MQVSHYLARFRERIVPILLGPPVLAFLPALALAAFWLGGEMALVLTSLGLPLLFAFLGLYGREAGRGISRDSVTGFMLREGFDAELDRVFGQTAEGSLRSACFVVQIDDIRSVSDQHGHGAADIVVNRMGERILSVLRDNDTVARLGDARFAICLAPVRQLDLELCIQLAGRIQTAVEDPVPVDGIAIYMSCSVGFCLRNRAPEGSSRQWFEAASDALIEAGLHGPSVIRSFTRDIQKRSAARQDLRDDATRALETGQIRPWFQPQVCTDTGRVSGFEALARWNHPRHGLLPPDEFLPMLSELGLMERLGDIILAGSMTALRAWDAAGAAVPRVAVNVGTDQLRDPALTDRVRWELDRNNLTADRLAVEIVETVVSERPDDMVTRNIRSLADLGCVIELDDFGTGHASISAIRRFRISRIKIDRSFILKADRDPEQQRLIGAILSMAERLDLDTVAEGVETVGEHALLAQLGCGHVQGFGIGRPMPFEQTLPWLDEHRAKLSNVPEIRRNAG